MAYGPIESCQLCGGHELVPALFLGYLPPVNSMRNLGQPADVEPFHPAELLVCRTCHLAQLSYIVDPEILFPPDYPYTSGSTRILRENFAELHRECVELLGLNADDLVVDIGSNDGTLLSSFKEGGHRVLGIEPTRTADLARERGIETMSAFFGAEAASLARDAYGPARLVTAANVFAHIPDVHAVVDAILHLLDDDGVFVSESGYLRELVETVQYDTIYHEHLRYYSLTSLKELLGRHGLRIFHAKRIPTHGGSIRVYATRGDRIREEPSVAQLLSEEADAKEVGARIYGIGAPSRASTLVNYVGLDDEILECVLEISGSKKLNKYMPGTAIPVLDEAKLYDDQPEYALLLSWHIADELSTNLRRKGFKGRFIVPLPSPRILDVA